MAGAGLIGGIAGDITSSEGQSNTNETNEAIANENNTFQSLRQAEQERFNAEQANMARAYNSSQVAQQEQFQQQQVQQAQAYNTWASDTQMQRRMGDLRAAGVNPLLAVGGGLGGATTAPSPTAQGAAASSPMASSGIASNPGLPNVQNSMSAFGNLGGQVSSAAALMKQQADIDYIKANTRKTELETNEVIPAQVQNIQASTGLSRIQAQQVAENINQIQETILNTRADTELKNSQINVNMLIEQLKSQNLTILKATRDSLITIQNNEAAASQLGMTKLENMNEIQQGLFGKFLTTLNAVLGPVSTIRQISRPSGGD